MISLPDKQCRRCKLLKPVDMFGKWSYSPDGLRTYCRLCAREILKESRNKPANQKRRNKFLSRPDVRERYNATRRQRYLKVRENVLAIRETPQYRAKENLRRWKRELKKAATDERRSECLETIAFWESEVERLSS